MADEEVKEEKAEAGAEGDVDGEVIEGEKKKFPLMTIIIVVVAVLIGAGAGVGGFLLFGPEPEPIIVEVPAEAKPVKKEAIPDEDIKDMPAELEEMQQTPMDEGVASKENLPMLKFTPFVVNVFQKNSIHYLRLALEVECSSEQTVEEVRSKMSKLRDRFLFMVNDISLREITTLGGKELLKQDLIREFNRYLTTGKIEYMYFTDLTIQ